MLGLGVYRDLNEGATPPPGNISGGALITGIKAIFSATSNEDRDHA